MGPAGEQDLLLVGFFGVGGVGVLVEPGHGWLQTEPGYQRIQACGCGPFDEQVGLQGGGCRRVLVAAVAGKPAQGDLATGQCLQKLRSRDW